MDFELSDEHKMLKDLAARFVGEELLPLEPAVLEREASGQGATLSSDELAAIDRKSRELGLWGLDAPEEYGGANLPAG
jgi:acyl-CoA dehydrogenase